MLILWISHIAYLLCAKLSLSKAIGLLTLHAKLLIYLFGFITILDFGLLLSFR